MDVNSLISHLSSNGVESFEGYGIKVQFHKQKPQPISIPFLASIKPETQVNSGQAVIDEPAMAQSLDGEISYDKVLNWSASPDASEPPTPLTGDEAPLTSVQG